MDLMGVIMVILGGIVILVGSALGGFIATMVVQGYGYSKLENRIYSLEQGGKSVLGVQARQEKAARMSEAMAKAVIIMKEPEVPQDEKNKKLLGLAAEYPDVAFDLVKKVGLKGLF